MENIQLRKLKAFLTKLKANAPYFTRKLAGVDPERLSGFAEFKEKIPLFNKADMIELVTNCGGDYYKALDQIMIVNSTDLDYIATTTGTTGVPVPYPMTNRDMLEGWGEIVARGAWRAGIRREDRVLFCFALSMVIAGVPTMIGIQKLGVTMIPVGAEAKSERILRTQNLFRGNVYMGTPSLAEYLIEQAPKILGKEVKELGFKALLLAGEPGAGIPSVKEKLETAYGCKIYDFGAGNGFSCGCKEYQGMHSVGDDLSYYELVDPETKEPIPFEHGARGEAVFTSLDGEGLVSLRASLGDIHEIFTEPCPCGQSGFRYKVVGRADDMLKVKGVMVYPSHIKGVINDFLPRLTGEHRIVLDERPPRVVPPLKLRLEHGEGIAGEALKALEEEIMDAMSNRLKIRPQILWAEPGSLDRSHYKGQVFERLYDKK
jgi:phenylacetate-CoA ligase